MDVPSNVSVDEATRGALASLALGNQDSLAAGLELRADWQARSGLDGRSFALVKIAALIALDAPPASYLWQVANALDAGATPEDIFGVLIAIAPQVGGASSEIRAAIFTRAKLRASRPLRARQSSRSSSPATRLSWLPRARAVSAPLVASSTVTSDGTVIFRILSVSLGQRWRSPVVYRVTLCGVICGGNPGSCKQGDDPVGAGRDPARAKIIRRG